LDVSDRFDNARKNDGSSIHDNLKPYRDATVVWGHVVSENVGDQGQLDDAEVDNQPSHVNYGEVDPTISKYRDFGRYSRTFEDFVRSNPGGDGSLDADFDLRLKIDLTKLEPDFDDTGWGDRDPGPEVFHQKFDFAHLEFPWFNYSSNEGYLGAEAIMYGWAGTCDSPYRQPPLYGYSLLPGWADWSSNSVLVNGRPVSGQVATQPSDGDCDFLKPCPYVDSLNGLNSGVRIGNLLISAGSDGKFPPAPGPGTYVRVTGALVLDCGHGIWHDCHDGDTDQNQEIHPIYSIDIVNYPFRPEDANVPAATNLTGTWAGNDGSTYYVRQIGSTIWWLGQVRDRQPMQRGYETGSPLIGTLQIAAAIRAGNASIESSGCGWIRGVFLGAAYPCWVFSNVFRGTVSQNCDGSASIQGEWAGVPQSLGPGNAGGTMSFTVDAMHKLIVPTVSHTIFPDTLQKIYEPENSKWQQPGSLTVDAPVYINAGSYSFVTNTTPFVVTTPDKSVVNQIRYRQFAFGSLAQQCWTNVPASSASFMLAGPDGRYEVQAYATNSSGNDGPISGKTVYLDNTAPRITITEPRETTYPHSASLTLKYVVSDGDGSGLKSVIATMDGGATLGGYSLSSGQTIDLLTGLPPGPHTFAVFSADKVNNTTSSSVTFSISVTPDSIKDGVRTLLQAGEIRSEVDAAFLLSELDLAAIATAKGQCSLAAPLYQAISDQAESLSGKAMSHMAESIIVAETQYLIAHCTNGSS
jgi:hypothetical protein